MTMLVFRTAVCVMAFAWFIAGSALVPHNASAQESEKQESSPESNDLKKLIERINKLESEVDRLKKGEPVAEGKTEAQILAMNDVAHLGLFYAGNGQTRFLVLHVMLANSTKNSYTISRDQVIAEIDGEEKKIKDLPAQLQNFSIQTGKQHLSLQTMRPPKEWKLPAGGQAAMWLVYPELPLGPQTPKCRLKIKLGEITKEIDVNEVQRAQLGIEAQRIGPRQCLALLTITGTMNSFNTGALAEALDKLVEQKVARVVIRWSDSATQPDPQIMQWLNLVASGNAGNPNTNPLFPAIATSIREFHLTEFPTNDDGSGRNNNINNFGVRPTGQQRIHKTAADSVGAALKTAYLALPRDELMAEIRSGNPLSRAAALAYGGGRLDVDQLPQIFEWAEDKDPELQRAALQALSHYGEPQAIEKLVFYAKRNIEPLSSSAIESMAGSRFGAAHEALLGLLKNEPPASKKKIVQVLAKYPRPVWSDTLFDFVNNSPAGMDVDSLKALIQVGHAQLVDVLERALKSQDQAIRDESFRELAKRSDDRSEVMAVEYALKLLEAGPPDATVMQLLSRTKEPRAIPLLIKQLNAANDRSNTINLLMQLGDQTVADALVQKYSSLNNNEKVQILQGLKLFRHAKFRELCGEALLTSDHQLVMTAANVLTQDGHADGEKLLIAALEKQKAAHFLPNIMNALANFGTPTARAALIAARDSGDQNKKTYANQALLMLRQRSPAHQYIFQAISFRQSKQEKEALEAFTMALQLDPELPEGLMGRGQLLVTLEKFADARKDLEKVIELKFEPLDSEFVTSLAIARVGDGRLQEGIKYLEDHRTKFLEAERTSQKPSKGLFLYNAACAYSRAVEQVDKQPDLPDREMQKEKYRKQAISDLTDCFKQGFEDYAWATKDPDLKALRDDPDFKALVNNKAGIPSEDKSDDDAK